MVCQKCSSKRIASLSAKCNDLCDISLGGRDHQGYVPEGLGIGGGDYVEFDLCLDCGTVQGTWPVPMLRMEKHRKDPRDCLPPRDERYEPYLNEIRMWLNTSGFQGFSPILLNLLLDSDTDKMIAGVIEIYRHGDYETLAETVCLKLEEWEHFSKLKKALRPYYNAQKGNEDDDD